MEIVCYLWRKFPWEHHPVKHVILEVILILTYTNLFSLSVHYLEVKTGLIETPKNIHLDIIITNLITLLITTIHETLFFYKQWKYNFSKSARLEKDNIEAKYEALKTQVNPHFLFNSLNSLTAIVDDNDEAVNYIQNLSDFLRYNLKSRDRELVLVREEVEITQKYLKLQKMRFNGNLIIDFDIPESAFHYALPPLVLQMLVENCLKHNIVSNDKKLTVKTWVTDATVYVENNLQKKRNGNSMGHGLKNIVERYRFFTTQEVKISETESKFTVEIPLLKVEL